MSKKISFEDELSAILHEPIDGENTYHHIDQHGIVHWDTNLITEKLLPIAMAELTQNLVNPEYDWIWIEAKNLALGDD